MRQSWSKLAHKCILYNNRCAKFYPDWLRFGSMRAKNLFLSKNRQRPSLCLGLTVHKIDKNSSKTLWVISKISAVIKILLTKIAESKVVNHAVEHPDPLKIRRRGRGTCFAPSAYKRKHSFIQNCCSIALQVSHHQG